MSALAKRAAMSALGQKRTSRHLFDHLVGNRKHARRNCKTERFGGLKVEQSTNQIARNVTGDVCSKCTTGIRSAAFLAEVGERKCKCRRHTETLHNPQNGECR